MFKIVLTGPESSGKTTLANTLAESLKAPVTEEFARSYLEKNGPDYTYQDFLQIIEGQKQIEEAAQALEPDILICDTSCFVLRIWSQVKYQRLDERLHEFTESLEADVYFLCSPEIPWEYDVLRENQDNREELYRLYKKELEAAGVNYYELKGSEEERLRRALNIIEMYRSSLNKVYDPEDFRKKGHLLIDKLADFFHLHFAGELPVNNMHSPEDELAFWKEFSENENDFESLINNVLERSIKVHNPRYIGHQVSAPMLPAALMGLVSNVMNNGMAVYEMGTVVSAMEKIVTGKIADKLGYDERSEGILTSGGTLANLTALLAARKAKAGTDVWNEGSEEKLAIMVSEQAHYCVDRAARIMGLGSEGIIKIPTDERYKMKSELLEEYLSAAEDKGFKVIAVIGSACSTSTGSYDDLDALAQFCAKHSLWLHVDGAHGAAVIFSEKYRDLVRGIEKADSVVLDGHKMMAMPALLTALVFKDARDSYAVFHQKAQYLWSDADSPEWFNYGKRTFECTKLMMSLRLFTVFHLYGDEPFRDYVELNYKNAEVFSAKLQERENFQRAVQPEANIVCFRYVKEEGKVKVTNKLNRRVRQELLEEGDFYIVQTELKGEVWLRCTFMSPFTKENDMDDLLDAIEKKAEKALQDFLK